ncbi:MAG: sulfatase-like hydrolase/transferase, partial [Pseudomonadota bacterium]
TDTAQDPRTKHANDPDLTTYEKPMVGFSHGSLFQVSNNIYEWTAHLRRLGHDIASPQSDMIDRIPAYGEPGFARGPAPYAAENSETAFLADCVIDYISEHPEQSWVIHASFLRPHPPLRAPAPYNTLYDCDDLPVPDKTIEELRNLHPYLDLHFDKQLEDDFFQRGFCASQHTHADRCDLRNVYYGMITECDTNLGRIFDNLKTTGQWDDTLIVLTSDHGEMLGENYLWAKMTFYDQSWRVPLLIRDPHSNTRGEFQGFTSSVDVAPTIASWIGAEIPDGWDGMDLLNAGVGRDAVYCEFDYRADMDASSGRHQFCLWRKERWKLVFFQDWPCLLFDMQNDPHEENNLAASPAHQTIMCEMLTELLAHRMQHADHELSKWRVGPDGATHI